jgi:hypothetical protein
MQGISWDVFTLEEQNAIKSAVGRGDRDNLVCCIESINMDLEKEEQIQKIVNQMTPEDEDFVSEVEDEVGADFLEGTPDTEKTPEMEEKYQEKLDAERTSFVAKKKRTKKIKEEILTNEDETAEVVESDKK